jgi:class 3 adenylate cyclase/tetratricopeptide (TPR) repeat protein/ribosomal protein L40E
MKCPSCGFENPPNFKFCGECGSKLKNICPNCGFENPPNFKFCGECGTQLKPKPQVDQPKPPTQQQETKEIETKEIEIKEIKREEIKQKDLKEKPVADQEKKKLEEEIKEDGKRQILQKEDILPLSEEKQTERRPISVLFADISGFTSLSEKLDPEELQFFIGDVLRKLADIVKKHKGHVDKFIGDEVMALFGAPVAYGDDSKRAVMCAVEMMNFIRENYKDISLHCGIATGEAVVGSISESSKDYTAMGDTVNIAKRLEEESKSWEILVDENTYLITKGEFEYKEVDVKLKGKTKDIKVFLLQGIKKQKTEFIGREKELERIKEILKSHPKFIAITGEAGIGISMFIDFFSSSRDDVIQVKLVSKENPYSVIKDILSNRVKNQDKDAIIELAEKQGVSHHILGYILGVAFPNSPLKYLSPEKLDEEVLNTTSNLLSGLIHDKILIIDNFDKADNRSQEIIFKISQNSDKINFSVVVGFEKGSIDETKLKNWHIITLERFDIYETEKFISKILGKSIDNSVAKLIWEKTEGNPFFIREILELMIENNGFEEKDGKVFLKTTFSLPKAIGIRQVILSRIDKLPTQPKQLLFTLSCLNTIYKPVIKRIFPPDVFQDAINFLKEKDIVSEEGEFIFFRQNLLKEVAYETLLKSKRYEIHMKLFNSAKEISGSDITCVLIAADQAEKAEIFDEAFLMYKKAGDILLEKINLKGAIEQYEKAANLINKIKKEKADQISEEIFDCLKNYGETLYHIGQFDKAKEIFELSEHFAKDELKKLITKRWIGDCRQIKGEFGEAEKIYKEILEELKSAISSIQEEGEEKTKYHIEYLRTLAFLCNLYIDKAEPENATPYISELLNHIKDEIKEKDIEAFSDIVNAIGRFYIETGDFKNAKKFFGIFYEISPKLGNLKKRGIAILNYGAALYSNGELDTAATLMREYLELARAILDVRGEAIALANLGQIFLESGRTEKAKNFVEQSVQIFQKIGDEYGVREAKEMLAEIKIYIRELEDAKKIIDEIYNLTDSKQKKSRYEILKALCFLGEEKIKEAKESLLKSQEIFPDSQNDTKFRICLSRIKFHEGEIGDAEKLSYENFENARTNFEKILSALNAIQILDKINIDSVIYKDKREKYESFLKKNNIEPQNFPYFSL